MATAPVSRRLNLTRDQLAEFLTDQQQIRQFELLFSTVDQLQVIVGTDFEYQADTAAATANSALAQIIALAQETNVNDAALGAKAQNALDRIALLAQETAVTVALAESKANQALTLVDKLNKAVEGLQMTPPPREFKRARYGSFYDTTTQTATVINTAKAITFNNTDLSNGVYLGSPTSRIIVDSEGIYNFDTSFQLDKTAGGTAEFYFWFRLNGVDVPDSASQIRIQGNNAEIFSSLNYFFDLKANDYVELMFSVSDLSVEVAAFPAAAPHPGIPSIILTVNNNIGGVQ
jgi:multidrug efflux pump subunit AcrA (membrane-fusion protein)